MKCDAALIDALVPAAASIIGGLVGGWFVLLGVRSQSRRQSEAAFRALMVEVSNNSEAAADMTRQTSGAFAPGHPDPGWLKHSIWDSQLPYVVPLFDEGTLIMVRLAYSLLDAVPAMEFPENAQRPSLSRYVRGGWIDAHLVKVRIAFSDADQALKNLRKRRAETRWHRVKAALCCTSG
jgi:hypothetical protein